MFCGMGCLIVKFAVNLSVLRNQLFDGFMQ